MQSIAIVSLLTSCSARKSAESVDALASGALTQGAQGDIAEQWMGKLAKVSPVIEAEALYIGRGTQRIRRLAARLNARFFVASAGLGLVSGDTRVPAYDLSISAETPAAVQRRVLGSFDAGQWWATIQRSSYAVPLSTLFEGSDDGLVLIAISNAYVALLADALTKLGEAHRNRLRLFGGADAKYPASLRHLLMPYDERLDALLRGSKVDFSQRAAEHFVTGVEGGSGFPTTLEDQRAWVTASLDAVVARQKEKRQVVDDGRILEFARGFAAQGLSHTKALSVLRKQHGIACEQSRFRRLFLEATACRNV